MHGAFLWKKATNQIKWLSVLHSIKAGHSVKGNEMPTEKKF